ATPPPHIYTLSLHDALPILTKRSDEILVDILLPPVVGWRSTYLKLRRRGSFDFPVLGVAAAVRMEGAVVREARLVLGAVASLPGSEEHTAELQSRFDLVCRL